MATENDRDRDAEDPARGPRITGLEIFRLRLPYAAPVRFASVRQSSADYVVVRLTASDGRTGLAEAVCRPEFSGEDAVAVAHQLDSFFMPLVVGEDALGHRAILARLDRIRDCSAAKSLIDLALWDLKGKILGQPVWRLLGGMRPDPVPLTWLAHGNEVPAMVDETRRMAETRGYRHVKLKAWRRSSEDLDLMAGAREVLGPEALIYVDANGRYSESEARAILSRVDEHDVRFVEDPCDLIDPARQARLAAHLPAALLGDARCDSLRSVGVQIAAGAVGAVSVKLRRTGLPQSLKIGGLCEAAGIPAIIGTDSESRIGAAARVHLRCAIPSLSPWPIETHFFDKLADDAFRGDFAFSNGAITPSDAPGFGVDIDPGKLERFAI